MTRRSVSRAARRPLGRCRFDIDPSWLNWAADATAPAPEIPYSILTVNEDGRKIAEVVVSTVSTVRRFISVRAQRGAYYLSNVVIIDATSSSPRLGELSIKLTTAGYAVTTTVYKSDGRFQVVSLDGGSYDVKPRS